jgi:hypothetical protein
MNNINICTCMVVADSTLHLPAGLRTQRHPLACTGTHHGASLGGSLANQRWQPCVHLCTCVYLCANVSTCVQVCANVPVRAVRLCVLTFVCVDARLCTRVICAKACLGVLLVRLVFVCNGAHVRALTIVLIIGTIQHRPQHQAPRNWVAR